MRDAKDKALRSVANKVRNLVRVAALTAKFNKTDSTPAQAVSKMLEKNNIDAKPDTIVEEMNISDLSDGDEQKIPQDNPRQTHSRLKSSSSQSYLAHKTPRRTSTVASEDMIALQRTFATATDYDSLKRELEEMKACLEVSHARQRDMYGKLEVIAEALFYFSQQDDSCETQANSPPRPYLSSILKSQLRSERVLPIHWSDLAEATDRKTTQSEDELQRIASGAVHDMENK